MTDLRNLKDAILRVPLTKGRRVIAIAGPPASGKSTLAEGLAAEIDRACVLPMDGFHRSNADLERHGLLARKGAPETFDVAGFLTLLRAIRTQGNTPFPTFDRTTDAVVPEGGQITAQDETILVEGNYLLLDVPPWDAVTGLWDLTVMLDVPDAELERRLVDRWLTHGHDHAGAVARAQGNDLPNALFMKRNSRPADLTVRHG